MVVDVKTKNKGMGKPKSLPGTPVGKNKGNFQQQKKSMSPNSKPGGGGAPSPKGPKGTPGRGGPGGKPFFKNNSPGGGKKPGNEGKSFPPQQRQQQQQKQENKQGPKQQKNQNQQNGSGKPDALKQLDPKSKPAFKGPKAASPAKQAKNLASKKNKNVNRYQRFQNRLNAKVRTPQACARAYKAEQELSASQGRVVKITLPDPVITPDVVNSWSNGIENIIFGKTLAPRQFTVVLKAGVNMKKELEKFNKIAVGNGKIVAKEQDPADLGHTGGKSLKDPSELIDPYTLYVTNLPDTMSKEELHELFPGSSGNAPKKHNPKQGNPCKYAFVSFETPEAALTALKENFNKTVEGKSLVMRFRRLNHSDLKANLKNQKVENKQKEPLSEKSKVNATAKAGKAALEVKKQDVKKQKQGLKVEKELKQEPADEDDDDDDEEDDEEMELDEDDDDDDSEGGEEMDDDDDDEEDDEDDEDDDDDDDDDE